MLKMRMLRPLAAVERDLIHKGIKTKALAFIEGDKLV